MVLRTQIPPIGSGSAAEIAGEMTGSVDPGTGHVVTGCDVGGWEVQPANTDVRTTSAIKRTLRIGPILHEDILIP
jgi:hypothetical protein